MPDKYIKISVLLKGKDKPRAESIWAKKIAKGKAEIANIPFFTKKCGLGDVVRYTKKDGERVFVKRIKKNTNTFLSFWRLQSTPNPIMWKLRINLLRYITEEL